MDDMKVKADDKLIELTEDYIDAIKSLMIEKMKLMILDTPENKHYWQVGGCKITDLMMSNGLSFQYGDKSASHYIKPWADIYVEL